MTQSDGATVAPVAQVQDLVKEYPRSRHQAVRALDGVSLEFNMGEFVVLLGPSGCGKTTLLRSIAGLEQPTGGTVRLRSRTVYSADQGIELPPERRGLSMMFQSYALWPNMTVGENVRYPLRSKRARAGQAGAGGSRRGTRGDHDQLVRETLALVGIDELIDRYPNQLSGGQQQRVALARALVWRDQIVLFDEPLSNVDAKVRDDLRREMSVMQRKLGFTAIYVTHDQSEAMQLGDRIVVMRAGRVEQQGSPQDIYLRPKSRFVANFVGASNEVAGTLSSHSGETGVVDTPIGQVHGRLDPEFGLSQGADVIVSWRPEALDIAEVEPTCPNKWMSRVTDPVFMGALAECRARIGEQLIKMVVPGAGSDATSHLGLDRWLSVHPDRVSILPA